MSGACWNALWQKIVPAFIDGSSRACRVSACGSGNMARIIGAAVIARVIFVDIPTMGGAESSTMPIIASGGL